MFVELLNTKTSGEVGEYCGRGSPVGNPFPITMIKTRDQVCIEYYFWFHEQIRNGNSYVLDYLNYLLQKLETEGVVRLRCHCVPLRCHTETIRDWLLENAFQSDEHY